MSQRLTEAEYNYDAFVRSKFGPLMRFGESPRVGETGADFPLWAAKDESKTSLSELWKAHEFLVVEFGSFT